MSNNNSNQKRRQSRKPKGLTVWQKCRRLAKNRVFLLVCLLAVIGIGCYVFFNTKNSVPYQAEYISQTDSTSATTNSMETTHETSRIMTTSTLSSTTVKTSSATTAATKSGSSGMWIKVDTEKQNVTIYDANNQVVKSFVCSTGLPGSDTPKGTYKIQERGYSFFSKTYQEGAYYWTQFSGDFLFHSVPFDKDRNIEAVEAAKLGTKASHGCVRLSMENAKWIYDNIPRGTKVVIE